MIAPGYHDTTPCRRVLRTCACGRSYTCTEWETLRFVGHWPQPDGYPTLELRDCECGSTISVELKGRAA